jgi:hypothetical protein
VRSRSSDSRRVVNKRPSCTLYYTILLRTAWVFHHSSLSPGVGEAAAPGNGRRPSTRALGEPYHGARGTRGDPEPTGGWPTAW